DLSGPSVQDLPRHGLPGRHEPRLQGPLLPGEQQEAGPRGRGGPRPLQGNHQRHHLSAHGRPAGRYGLHRLPHHRGAAAERPVHADHGGRPAGVPPPRYLYHQGSSQLHHQPRLITVSGPRLPARPIFYDAVTEEESDMERYTQRREETWALAEGAELSRALDRLGRCEDLLSDLEREQTELAQKLEELRLQGKNKTVQFKELMARKLVNQQLRLRLEQYRLP